MGGEASSDAEYVLHASADVAAIRHHSGMGATKTLGSCMAASETLEHRCCTCQRASHSGSLANIASWGCCRYRSQGWFVATLRSCAAAVCNLETLWPALGASATT